ncbi:MAG: reverse transcriptase family protein [Moritella sp.]|uniref:RNA-directed DNA polymerase n=1 Tax=Moritella sp. TaxID=78556 RepID=UPI001DD10C85|nr:reverse transcriptase family protein [Moritella sp.]NQZ52225.1 reverse transcriptase family protein [Moritella sp.]
MDLNKDIEGEDSKNINWKKFKKLKGLTTEAIGFDDFDLQNFYMFFKKLYHDHQPLQDERCNSLQNESVKLVGQFHSNSNLTNHYLLDDCFTIDELISEIRKLKTGKSASLDLICNEMIKNLNNDFLSVVLDLFNGCLSTGTYPWLSSIMSPIPKTGDKYNPDNYRAIALGSCLGKLFSNLLLCRIQKFRILNCPDLPSQLGFTHKAQTSDHILTLKTLIDKYTAKKGSKLYACFVDFRKAFDSVARHALLYKLAKLGIEGQIFNCLKYMYDNSSTKIKLINKLSDHINLKNGVEQGHPLSPELFKIYILDLSHELEKILGNLPHLKDTKISHLLWADDLVLLALDEPTLQSTLDVLTNFCDSWGLQINPKKTKILIFNKSGKLIKPSTNLRIGDETIESTNRYCYLGIVFTPSGSFTTAINELKKKALRATFALKKFINHKFISVSTIFKLFDALIIPILTYACQISFPYTKFASSLISTKTTHTNWQSNWLTKISKDPFENLHLKFTKWVLGVHRKASNVGAWGESGRHPIGVLMLKQTIKYFNRISTDLSPSSLVHLSYLEQQSNSMKWFSAISKLITAHGSPTTTKDGLSIISAGKSAKSASTMFENIWSGARTKSPKLEFYNSIKQFFAKESYLDCLDFDLRKTLTCLRISAHRLPIERGRYLTPPLARNNRHCEVCKFHRKVSVVGDEAHFLLDCVSSSKNRNYLSPHNMNLLNTHNYNILSDLTNQNTDINNLAIFIRRSYLDYLKDLAELPKAKQ